MHWNSICRFFPNQPRKRRSYDHRPTRAFNDFFWYQRYVLNPWASYFVNNLTKNVTYSIAPECLSECMFNSKSIYFVSFYTSASVCLCWRALKQGNWREIQIWISDFSFRSWFLYCSSIIVATWWITSYLNARTKADTWGGIGTIRGMLTPTKIGQDTDFVLHVSLQFVMDAKWNSLGGS